MGRGSIRLLLGWLSVLVVSMMTAATAHASSRAITSGLASTGQADAITASEARLNGVLLPSVAGSSWFFQYGTSRTLASGAQSTAPQALSSALGDLDAVSQMVGRLRPHVTYYFRVVLNTPALAESPPFQVLGAIEHFQTLHSFGRAQLARASAVVSHGAVALPLRCRGARGAVCATSVTLTHTRASGRRVTCAQARSHARAAARWALKLHLSPICRRILAAAPHGRLGTTLHAAFQGGQTALTRSVTLIG